MNKQSALDDVYLRSFRMHAHELIAMGYQELNVEDLSDWQEPEITGELVRAMREVMECSSAPEWVENYAILEDPPLNIPEKRGKNRPRVDIEFECTRRGRRPHLQFEAKRLGKNHTVSQYLGQEGLGCFLSGKYQPTHAEAGMLGYVQNDNETVWAAKLENALREDPAKYGIADTVQWEVYLIVPRLVHTYRSKHYCEVLSIDIHIFHTLLRFCT